MKTKLTWPADNKKLRDFIEFLKSDMEKYKVNPKSQFNLVTSAEEIFSNIADYAYLNKDEAIVDIETFVDDNIYYVKFTDNGKEYNPLLHKDPDLTLDLKDRDIGGLGIFLAKKMSDKISYSYENKQNILTIGVLV